MRKEQFLSLLKKKYGEHIVETLLDADSLTLLPENIKSCSSDIKGKCAVVAQMRKLESIVDELKPLCLSEFSFDFPGWIDTLDFNRSSAKEILILGLEPHIEFYYYQICYDFSGIAHFRITPHKRRGFWIRTFPFGCKVPERNLCKDRLWDIMFRLLSEHTYQFSSTEMREPDQELTEILQRFYITDLCHFAPRGNASRIYKDKKFSRNWPKIRRKVANIDLNKEIGLINPKLIIAQGNASKTFFKDVETEKVASDGTFKNLPCKGKYCTSENECDILFIPHTSRMAIRFWNSCNIKQLRAEISELLANQ